MNTMIRILQLGLKFNLKMSRDNIRAHAAATSFFMILSFIPFLMLLLTAVQFTPLTQELVLEVIETATPFEISETIRELVGSLFNNSYALLSWTAIVAIWTSSKAIIGLTDGLNSVNQLEETRNFFVMRIWAVFYTAIMLIIMIIAIGILVFGYRIQQYLRDIVPLIDRHAKVTLALQMILSLSVLTLLFELLYVFLPNKRKHFLDQLPGAVFTAISWAAFSYVFSIYLEYAGNMTAIYGGLTTLIVVMLWLYFCMYLFFTGAEINQYITHPELFAEKAPESERRAGGMG